MFLLNYNKKEQKNRLTQISSGQFFCSSWLCGPSTSRDAKMYECANNVSVKIFLLWVKILPNFMLFCCKSELCCDFALFGCIFVAAYIFHNLRTFLGKTIYTRTLFVSKSCLFASLSTSSCGGLWPLA